MPLFKIIFHVHSNFEILIFGVPTCQITIQRTTMRGGDCLFSSTVSLYIKGAQGNLKMWPF